MSKPMVKFMNTRAKKPTTVVMLLARMELMASSMAFTMASSSSSPSPVPRVKESSRKME